MKSLALSPFQPHAERAELIDPILFHDYMAKMWEFHEADCDIATYGFASEEKESC
jgi:hypothetical protein